MRVNLYKIAIFIFAAITILILTATIIVVKSNQQSKQLNKISEVTNNQINLTPTPHVPVQNTEEKMLQSDSAIQTTLDTVDKELNEVSNMDVSDDSLAL